MTVTEGRMTWGDFKVPLVDNVPRSVIRALDDGWYGLIRVYPQRIRPGQVDSVRGLFTGAVLDRPDRFTVGGAGATWFLGEATDGTGDDEVGPVTLSSITKNGTTNGSLEGWLDNVLPDTECGIVAGVIGGPSSATKYAGTFTRRTPKTIFDSWLCPRFGVEYRVNPDLTIDFGYESELYPAPDQPVVAIRRGGRDPAIDSVNAAELGMTQTVRDQASRVITVISEPSTYQAVYAGDWPYLNPQGDPLNRTHQKGGTASDQADVPAANGEALADATATLGELGATQRTIEISTLEYALSERVAAGYTIYVYDLDEGLFDRSNPMLFRGKVIYPVALRVQEVTWPVQSGMSVLFDNRHQGGGVIDLTTYIDYGSEPVETGITVGAPPDTIGGRIRRRRR